MLSSPDCGSLSSGCSEGTVHDLKSHVFQKGQSPL